MPQHLLLDAHDDGAASRALRGHIESTGGQVLVANGADPAQVAKVVATSSASPDEILFLLSDPSHLVAARAARVRACAVEPDAARRILWTGIDELWPNVQAALRWLDRQIQLEARAWPIATVGGLVFRSDDAAFFVRTAKWDGTWGVPGGKIEYGERHEDAFAREIREETDLSVSDVRLVLVQDAIEEPEFHRPRHFLLLNYTARTLSDSVRLNHESLEGGWFQLREALELRLNRPTRALVEHVLGA